MNLKIRNANTKRELPVQQFNITSTGSGKLECPTMVDKPADKEYIILPYEIKIQLTTWESKHPHFKVVE
jgi:hypothetical protein